MGLVAGKLGYRCVLWESMQRQGLRGTSKLASSGETWKHGTREILGTASVSEVEKAVWGRKVSLVGRTPWRESLL